MLLKIYFGWWITIVNAILTGLAGGFRTQGFSALFKPIAQDLGLSRAGVSLGPGLSTLLSGFTFALAGWLSDRFGPKWVIITGSVSMGTGLVLMYFVNSPVNYYIIWGVIIAAGTSLGYSVPQDKMLTDWFVSKRGLALGIRFAIVGLVAASIMPVQCWLIVKQGWRMTCLIWGGVVFAGIPLMLYFVRQKRPEYYGLLPDGVKVDKGREYESKDMIIKGQEYAAGFQEMEFSLKEAMKTRTYWLLTIAWISHGIIFHGFTVHCIPFLTDMGIDPVAAGGLMGMMIVFTIPSRFLGGMIADRFEKGHLKYLLSMSFIFTALGISIILLNQSRTALYVLLIFIGLGLGSFIPLDIVIRARFFGRKAYGSIQGSTAMIAVPFMFFSPVCTGWIYDSTGNYKIAFTLFALITFSNAIIILLMNPPKELYN